MILLTLKERQIIELLMEGKTQKQIALIMLMTTKNVERYLSSLRTRYDCTTTTQLIIKIMSENPTHTHQKAS